MSVPIRGGMVHYPGDPEVRMWRQRSIAQGDLANITQLDFGLHSGTHVDAPVHWLEGAAGADALALEALIGPADVVDGTSIAGNPIAAGTLSALPIPDDCERLLLKTRNSTLWEHDEFLEDFLCLDGSGARFVVDRGIQLIGIDYLSIGDEDAHKTLLSNGVIPLEGLDLRAVDPGRYELLCLPLRIVGADGSPARVLLRR